MSGGKPITRSLAVVDRVLAVLILLMGAVMAYLAIASGNLMIGLASIVFLGIGVARLWNVFRSVFRSIANGSAVGPKVYRNVLLPVSRPEAVESMVKMAADVLGPGGKLTMTNVIVLPPQLPAEAEVKKDDARKLLEGAAGIAARMGVDTKAEIVMARTAVEAILDRAKEYRCDLIVMGSSRRTPTEKVLFGNVADEVLRHAPCDVMVLSYENARHPAGYEKILVPTAGYRHSTRALDIAADIAKKSGGNITALYVGREEDSAKGRRVLANARQRMEQKGVGAGVRLMTGSVENGILDAAREGGYSLIIIGATEHPKYYTALLGNIADHVVRRAPCDVLVVRTRA